MTDISSHANRWCTGKYIVGRIERYGRSSRAGKLSYYKNEAHERSVRELLSGDADRARTDLLRDRHVQIRLAVVCGRLQASVVVGSTEECPFCRRR